MRRIAARFASLPPGEKALIGYVAAGDPNLATSRLIVNAMARNGIDLIELGMPFSDPLADGPVIQAGSVRALAAGATPATTFELVEQVRADGVTQPILIMTYYNLLLHMGLERFCDRAVAVGVDGLIIPDLPLEEAEELGAACEKAGLDLVQFVAPTSTPARIERAAKAARGFLYAVGLTGVTGSGGVQYDRVIPVVERAKAAVDLPVAVGFGVTKPEHAAQVAAFADAVIVGTALVRLCGEEGAPEAIAARVGRFVGELKTATKTNI
ncbi:MAG TPA: tryptophan synthase subunit alpha [Symbiobacteriaceae bacterium]|nr:tryptophan synthase subunit alpha [Symbiobacteriaceae bacterium]